MAAILRRKADPADAVITTARRGRSVDLASRELRYAITMGIRVACFIAMIFVGGVWRWVLLGGAAFLPGIAVVLANAIDKRGQLTPVVHDPGYRKALTPDASPHSGATILDHEDDA